MENHHSLVVDGQMTQATGTNEQGPAINVG